MFIIKKKVFLYRPGTFQTTLVHIVQPFRIIFAIPGIRNFWNLYFDGFFSLLNINLWLKFSIFEISRWWISFWVSNKFAKHGIISLSFCIVYISFIISYAEEKFIKKAWPKFFFKFWNLRVYDIRMYENGRFNFQMWTVKNPFLLFCRYLYCRNFAEMKTFVEMKNPYLFLRRYSKKLKSVGKIAGSWVHLIYHITIKCCSFFLKSKKDVYSVGTPKFVTNISFHSEMKKKFIYMGHSFTNRTDFEKKNSSVF